MALRLFILEFRRAVFSFLVIVLGTAAACFLAEHVYLHFEKAPSNVHEAVNLLIIFVIGILGFPSGSRAFSSEFKETSYLFLQSLPLARERAWLALVLANLSASLISILVLIGLRPSILTSLPESYHPEEVFSATLIVYFVLFCAGSCFSLLFRKVVLNYIAGFFVCAIVASELLLEAVNQSGDYYFYDYGGWGTDYFPLMVTVWVLVCLAFLALSMRFFACGEFNLSRVQLRNCSLIVSSLAVLFVLIGLGEGMGLFAAFDKWTWWGNVAQVSNDGKYLLVVEARERHPYIVRRNTIEVATGRTTGRSEEIGESLARWSLAEDDLNTVVSVESPLLRLGYILPASTKFLVLSPQGRVLTKRWFIFSEFVAIQQLGDGGALFVARRGSEGIIFECDNKLNNLRELARGKLTGYPSIYIVPDGYLVFFRNDSDPWRLWLVGSEVKELQLAPSRTKQYSIACVIQGIGYSEVQACQRELARLYPFPNKDESAGKATRRGYYFLRDETLQQGWMPPLYLTPSSTILYLAFDAGSHSGKLYAWNSRQLNWREVVGKKPLDGSQVSLIQDGFVGRLGWPESVASSEGLAAYTIENGSNVDGYLYDATLDKTFDLGTVPKLRAPQMPIVAIRRFDRMKSDAVFFGEGDNTEFVGNAFQYLPGSGTIRKLPHPVKTFPSRVEYMDDEGNLIYERGREPVYVDYMGADGRERQLWPLKP